MSIIYLFCSGDQDAVVPLLGSRTLVRELAHHLNFKTTLPYRPWFHKDQVSSLILPLAPPCTCLKQVENLWL